MASAVFAVLALSTFLAFVIHAQGHCDCVDLSDNSSVIVEQCDISSESDGRDVISCNLRVNGARIQDDCKLGRNEFKINPMKRGGNAVISCISSSQIDLSYNGSLPQLSFDLQFRRQWVNISQWRYETILTTAIENMKNGNYRLFSVTDPRLHVTLALHKLSSSQSKSASISATSIRLNLKSLTRPGDGKNGPSPIMVCSSELKSNIQRLINVYTNNTVEARYKLGCLFESHRCFNKREGSLVECSKYVSQDYSCKHVDLKPPGGLVSCFVDGNMPEAVTKEYFIGLDNNYHFQEDWPGGFLGMDEKIIIKLTSVPKEIIRGIPVQFKCDYVSYILVESVTWFARYKGGGIAPLVSPNVSVEEIRGSKFMTSILNAVFDTDVTEVICTGSVIYSSATRNASVEITVLEGTEPRIVTERGEVTVNLENTSVHEIRCEATGTPLPEFEWYKPGFNISTHALVTNGTDDFDLARNFSISWSVITFRNRSIPELILGNLECIARNTFGEARKIFRMYENKASRAYFYGTTIGIPVTVATIVLLLCISLYLYWNRQVIGLTKEEIEEFMKGKPHNEDKGKLTYLSIVPATLPYDQALEVSEDNLIIDFNNVLGSGAYGLVLKGFYKKTEVAIKTLKSDARKQELKTLLAELKLMVYIGSHPHISRMVGAVTKHLSSGKVYVILEFYRGGSLESHLKKNRCVSTNYANIILPEPRYTATDPKSAYKNIAFVSTDEIPFKQLCLWSFQIADGLEHLSKLKVVHGDLAARNILLDEHEIAKISDFGLSRKLYEYTKYVKQSQEPLPWRWMAIESLRDLSFSMESDTWSFGVTMWEIFSMALIPYPGMNWSMDFITELLQGMRLNRPDRATPAVYDLMLKCWNICPNHRPTSTQLKESLRRILEVEAEETSTLASNNTTSITYVDIFGRA